MCISDNAKSITELHLIEAGLTIPSDRLKILDALHVYSKEQISYSYTPSAPALENEASAPSSTEIRAINAMECVICLDVEVWYTL